VTMVTGGILLLAIWVNTNVFARWLRRVEREDEEPAA